MSAHRIAAAWGREIESRRVNVLKMSRAQLAEHLGVTRQMVRLWETGQHAPSSRMQALLIERLGIDPMTVAKLIQAAA